MQAAGSARHSPTTLYGAPSNSIVIPFLKSLVETWAARTTRLPRRAVSRCTHNQGSHKHEAVAAAAVRLPQSSAPASALCWLGRCRAHLQGPAACLPHKGLAAQAPAPRHAIGNSASMHGTILQPSGRVKEPVLRYLDVMFVPLFAERLNAAV